EWGPFLVSRANSRRPYLPRDPIAHSHPPTAFLRATWQIAPAQLPTSGRIPRRSLNGPTLRWTRVRFARFVGIGT
ncbi:hypothetical protein GW17_00016852, partial [Ensete ventricosum]